MSAMVCGLQVQGDIFLGGAASEDIIDLPTSKDELASFLSGSSAKLLWNYTVTSPCLGWSIVCTRRRELMETLYV